MTEQLADTAAVPGPASDRFGNPVFDPSKNVLDLVRAAIERQDDLRRQEAAHARQIGDMRADYQREINRIRSDFEEKLRDSDRALALSRANFEEKLRNQESARIDAIRAVDVGAVSRAAEVSAAQAQTLATQQQASADALRNQVEQARIATADALAQALAPITKSIEDLRAAQYQQQGEKSQSVTSGTTDRDAIQLEQARIQAAAQRVQVYALIVAALVLAVGLYAAFHKLRSVTVLVLAATTG